MTSQCLESGSAFPAAHLQAYRLRPLPRRVTTGSLFGGELHLKLLMATLFLPEGLSFFIGDFRLTVARAVLIILSIAATGRFFQRVNTSSLVCVPSDFIAMIAGIWMILASLVTGGFMGLKGGGMMALEFTGTYYVFRYFLGPDDSSVRVIRVSCLLIILVIGVALLDPLSGKLFTYELVKDLTGYVKPTSELNLNLGDTTESLYRHGLIRAMGPLEHSILFGTVCVWFGALALCTFPSRLFGWSIAGVAFIGVLFSQSKGPLTAGFMAFALAIFYCATKHFAARWKVLGLLAALGLTFIFFYSGNFVGTLMKLGGMDPSASWYRQAIWSAAVPLVVQSPLFGVGLADQWDWQSHPMLSGPTVDTLWLRNAMMVGIPGSVLSFLTVVSAFWLGPIDTSRYLSREEKRLSVALGIVITSAIYLGFIVHFWGTCWILLGAFPGMRANLAEAAILRRRAARGLQARSHHKCHQSPSPRAVLRFLR